MYPEGMGLTLKHSRLVSVNSGFIEEELNGSQDACVSVIVLSTIRFEIELRFRETLEMMHSNPLFIKKLRPKEWINLVYS